MSKSVKQKLIAIISSLSSTEFVHFFQEYLNTLNGTNIKFQKQMEFMDLHKYSAVCKIAGISGKGEGKNPSQAMVSAMRKLVSNLVEFGNFTDIFIMCLKRKNKQNEKRKQRTLTQPSENVNFSREKTNKQKQKEQLQRIRRKISQLEGKLKNEKTTNIELKNKYKKKQQDKTQILQTPDKMEIPIQKTEKIKVKRFRTQLSELKLNSSNVENESTGQEKEKKPMKMKLRTEADEYFVPKKANVPKLNLKVLDNYHDQNQTPLNDELLKKYMQNHS